MTMPKILKPAEEKIIKAVRDIIVFDPLISTRSLQSVLEKKGINIGSREYLSKIVWKIGRGLSEDVNRQELSARIAQIKEKHRIVIDRLVRIAFYTDDLKKEGLPPPSYKDQIAASYAIMKLDLAVLGAEMDAGIFERHIGTLEIEKRNRPLPKEIREKIRQALINWGTSTQELIKKHDGDQSADTDTAIVRGS